MDQDFTLGANNSQQVEVVGSFFKYKTGTGAIRVRTSDGANVKLLPGEGVRNRNFKSLTITDLTGATNTGVLFIDSAEFISDNAATQVSIPARQFNPFYTRWATSANSVAALAANVPAALILPAVNINGIILHAAGFSTSSAIANTSIDAVMCSDSVAPFGINSSNILFGIKSVIDNATYRQAYGELAREIFLPAGQGLYFISNQAEGLVHLRYALYTAL